MYDENNWARRDTQTSVVYYGYTINPTALDSDNTWCIKRVSTIGTVDSVTWANGYPTYQISTWNNRVACFLTPSNPISITYSVSTTPYNTVNQNISIGWNGLTGIDQYQVLVSNTSGVVYSDGGYLIYQSNGNSPITSLVTNSNSYTYKYGVSGTTYSITVTGLNVAGTTSSTVLVGV